ncbi:hypothetical protein AVEN_111706-1 [Araneus ventricosus]|uniref:Uncharacterized protein n=1 Tax=Araneus ventricosus TaxID=182803 RepID=A0A4Y2C8I4_ARAVE|nr:hypothetical protein AVEN_111706-1 [Araneus ventricosus]
MHQSPIFKPFLANGTPNKRYQPLGVELLALLSPLLSRNNSNKVIFIGNVCSCRHVMVDPHGTFESLGSREKIKKAERGAEGKGNRVEGGPLGSCLGHEEWVPRGTPEE